MKNVNQEIDNELLAHAASISRLADKATTRIAKIRLITLTFAIFDVLHASGNSRKSGVSLPAAADLPLRRSERRVPVRPTRASMEF